MGGDVADDPPNCKHTATSSSTSALSASAIDSEYPGRSNVRMYADIALI